MSKVVKGLLRYSRFIEKSATQDGYLPALMSSTHRRRIPGHRGVFYFMLGFDGDPAAYNWFLR